MLGGRCMQKNKKKPKKIPTKERRQSFLINNVYLNFPDLQFYNWCNQQFRINRGVFNTIDQWFYDFGITEVILRRIYILSFLNFVREAESKAEQQKFIRFGKRGLVNRLFEFIVYQEKKVN